MKTSLVFLSFSVFFFHLAIPIIATTNEDSPYTWVCEEKKQICVKTLKVNLTQEQGGKSLSICKLNCGQNGVLWPLPTGKVEIGKEVVNFVPGDVEFSPFQTEDPKVKLLLQNATQIFNTYLPKMHPDYIESGGSPSFGSVAEDNKRKILISIGTVWPDVVNGLQTDESYVLSITTNSTHVHSLIQSNTFFGARHGLETLSQLIAYDQNLNTLAIVKGGSISDSPMFPYRGIMIDTSRNYFSIQSLQRLIDGMSYTKLNILHWHITDTHSFPFVSKRVPEMSLYGAYSQKKVYTPDQIKDLVSYARVRGVKIVPEFDEPAHTGNGWEWGPTKGLGDLAVCVNQEPWAEFCVEPPCGQLNIVNENVYEVLGNIFKDLFDLFDPDIFHMGGDEINFNCWNSTKEITDWMKLKQIPTTREGFLDLWSQFQNKAYEKVKEANGGKDLTAILWTSELTSKESVEKYLSNSTYVIQIWSHGQDELIPFLISKNYKIILSNYDAWYLDCGYGAWVGNSPNNWCTPYKGWQQVYSNSPLKILANRTSVEEAEKWLKAGLVLGGVSPMWSEQVDEESLEGKVWPRGSALGERLWTNPSTSGWSEAETRMIQTRQRYVERGLRPDRLQPEWCHQNEKLCY